MQVAHFVQEDRAAVGQFELAAAQRRGAGERALLVSEQFASRSAPSESRRSSPSRTDRPRTGWRCGCAPPAVPCRCPIRRSAARARPTARRHRRLLHRAHPGRAGADHLGATRPPARAAARSPAAGWNAPARSSPPAARGRGSSGFSRKSKAPARVASTASAMVPWPEIMMAGAVVAVLLHRRSRSMPLPSGSFMSSR